MTVKRLTPELTKRVTVALSETEASLTRALRYSPDLREDNLIAFYERHIARLKAALTSGEIDLGHKDSAGPRRFS